MKTLLKLVFYPIFLYGLTSVLCSLVVTNHGPFFNGNKNEVAEDFVYLLEGAIHVDLLLPFDKGFEANFPWLYKKIKIEKPDTRFVAIGWGDKQFYCDTSSWSDLNFSLALNVLFVPSASVIHAVPMTNLPKQKGDLYRVDMNKEQKNKLLSFVSGSFKPDHNQDFKTVSCVAYPNYGTFYSAKRKYSMLYTCNSWVNEGLKEAGVSSVLWTNYAFGVTWQHKKKGRVS